MRLSYLDKVKGVVSASFTPLLPAEPVLAPPSTATATANGTDAEAHADGNGNVDMVDAPDADAGEADAVEQTVIKVGSMAEPVSRAICFSFARSCRFFASSL